MKLKLKTKKPTYKDLAIILGVSESAIKQYNPKKRTLMILGLWIEKEEKTQDNLFSSSTFNDLENEDKKMIIYLKSHNINKNDLEALISFKKQLIKNKE